MRLWMPVAGLLVLGGPALSQSAAPTFEAASIKPTQMAGQGVHTHRTPGMIQMTNVTLQDCIRLAYDVTDFQISGGKWLGPDTYDIVAKMPAGEDQPTAMLQALQALLADRFKLKVHRATKDQQVYMLVIAKNGPKIHAVETQGGGVESHQGFVNAESITMARLATLLSREKAQLENHTVVDRTGLSGNYTFKLEWTPTDKQSADAPGTSLLTALQEQLGLKLGAGKAQLEFLIVDYAEKPSEN
jgi:uncharacterized protein (TIGR03435 family)